MVKAQQRVNAAKHALDDKTQNMQAKDRRARQGHLQQEKIDQAKAELDQTEIGFYEANLSYNLMVVNMAYSTINQFKVEK